MSVGVGSVDDPREWPGIAHLLEHMLFLGSVKYPDPNGYNQYLSRNGGSSNAFTGELETNYYLQVKESGLDEALDRLS